MSRVRGDVVPAGTVEALPLAPVADMALTEGPYLYSLARGHR